MCGLVGIAGDLGAKHRDIFKTLLVIDTLRGPHSTGVMSVGVDKSPVVLKKSVLPQELFDMGRYSKVVTFDSQVLMGHNRYATMGKVNSVNAHPFEHGDIVGAHNGTLTGKHLLPESNNFEVDSDNLVYAVNKLGTEEALAVTQGAFALSLYNQKDHTLQLVRNSERPLFFAYTEDKKCLLWASERWMLTIAASRSDIKLCKKITEAEELRLYTFQLPDKKTDGVSKPRTKKVKEHVPVKHSYPQNSQQGGGGPYYPDYSRQSSWRAGSRSSCKVSGKKGVSPDLQGVRRGDIVRYWAIDKSDSHSGRPYIQGILVNDTDIIVKIFETPTMPDMLSHCGEVEGQVSYVVEGGYSVSERAQKEGQLIIDPTTIKLIPPVNQEKPLTQEGPNGVMITEAIFDELTKHGCSSCQTNLLYDYDVVHWVHDSPLCDDCYAGYNSKTGTALSIHGGPIC